MAYGGNAGGNVLRFVDCVLHTINDLQKSVRYEILDVHTVLQMKEPAFAVGTVLATIRWQDYIKVPFMLWLQAWEYADKLILDRDR